MANTYLTHTHGGAATLLTKGTFSAWIKRSAPSGEQTVFTGNKSDNNQRDFVRFEANSQLRVRGCGGDFNLETTQKLRDVNSWYHVVVSIDTTQGTDSNRVKIYLNGSQITSFSSPSYPSQNYTLEGWSNQTLQTIGRDGKDSNTPFDGNLAHVHWIDGTAYDATAFGETDSTTGIWKPKMSPSVTYGNNGFFLKFENSGSMGTDSSSNSNNFSINGTITQLIDTPSNVFCTANALSKGSDTVLSNGNNTARNDSGNNSNTLGTIAFGNGKYYWEAYRHGGGNDGIGICLASVDGTSVTSVTAGRVLYYQDGTIYCEGLSDQSNISTGVSFAHTDIISVSMDTENGVLKFYKNDTLVTNSTITNSKLTNAENIWLPHTYQNNGGEWRLNFGNGYFGTTAISSQGTNASNNGKFEYDVKPSDATAVSTKGLNL